MRASFTLTAALVVAALAILACGGPESQRDTKPLTWQFGDIGPADTLVILVPPHWEWDDGYWERIGEDFPEEALPHNRIWAPGLSYPNLTIEGQPGDWAEGYPEGREEVLSEGNLDFEHWGGETYDGGHEVTFERVDFEEDGIRLFRAYIEYDPLIWWFVSCRAQLTDDEGLTDCADAVRSVRFQ